MVRKARKTRSDKGKTHNYPKERKKPRPYNVRAHTRGGPLALGDLWGDEKGLKSGRLMTEKDRAALKLGSLWGTDKKKK